MRTFTLFLVLLALVAASSASAGHKNTLQHYASGTWHSFDMMLYPQTGLPADNVSAEGVKARYTSPTNIGAYLWSTIAARDLKLISPADAAARIDKTLSTLATLERHAASGQFYNWYDPQTGQKLTVWPADGNTVYPFLSTVDNAWLAMALVMVANAVPQEAAKARALYEPMNFGFYYNPSEGQMRGGAWTEQPPGCSVYDAAKNVYFTCHHYGTLNTEPRIASYIAIARGQVPPTHYYRLFRTFPDTCDWNWQEMQPHGVHRTYLGVDVFEGHYTYAGMNIVPSWGGSMFEALMVPLFVPEEQWAKRSWGRNHPLYVKAQIYHGLKEARYGYWGFSPSNNPDGGYREYGVDPIGLNPDGYPSDQERTLVDYGFDDCRPAAPPPAHYGRGVVTPHASFLALDFARKEALKNLEKLAKHFDAYGPGGFYDAIDVVTGKVSRYHLALDQGMIMAAIANELTHDRFQRYFAREVESSIRPLIGMEEFTAGK
jgi:putative glucoamylase/uncharacterized protein DUF3131